MHACSEVNPTVREAAALFVALFTATTILPPESSKAAPVKKQQKDL